MIGSIAVSLGWLILGTITSEGTYDYTYLGIEPFYPGLVVSIALWLMGRVRNGELLEETDFAKEEFGE